MAFTTSTERLITSIVSKILDEPGMRMPEYLEPRQLLYNTGVLFDLTLEVYDDALEWQEREKTKSQRFYFVAFCGNTSVFVVSRERTDGDLGLRHLNDIDPNEWENLGNHDSCWRDSLQSWMNDTCWKMCDEVNQKTGFNVAPIKLTTDCQVGFINPWSEVKMVTIPDKDKDDSYWRKIQSIKYK